MTAQGRTETVGNGPFAADQFTYVSTLDLFRFSVGSMAALPGPERIILRLKRPVQGWAFEELGWVMMTQRDSRSECRPWGQDRKSRSECEAE
jgi:hypothetical protein